MNKNLNIKNCTKRNIEQVHVDKHRTDLHACNHIIKAFNTIKINILPQTKVFHLS